MRIGLLILLLGVLAWADEYPKFVRPDHNVCAEGLANHHSMMVRNRMVTNRTLEDYRKLFGDKFLDDLKVLGADDQWIDSGSGAGIALSDYQKWGKAKTVGIVVELPDGVKKISTPHNRILDKRYLEEIPPEELGPTDLVSDGIGPTAYAYHFDHIVNIYLKVVKTGGVIWLSVDNVTTKIHTKEAGTLDLAHYLKLRLKGHEVEFFGEGDNQVRIKLTDKGPRKLPSMDWEIFATANPPYREYIEK